MSEIRTYALILFLPDDINLTIGTLGTFEFPAGFYGYVDDVAGPSLAGRLKKHLDPTDRPKTHIDYLQQVTAIYEIWLSSSTVSRRDTWADTLAAIPGGISLIEGFGSDDEDESYLIYFDVRPGLEDFSLVIRQQYSSDVVLRAFAQDESEETGETPS